MGVLAILLLVVMVVVGLWSLNGVIRARSVPCAVFLFMDIVLGVILWKQGVF